MPYIQNRQGCSRSYSRLSLINSAILVTVILFACLNRVEAQNTIYPLPTFAPPVSYPIGTDLNQRVIVADFDNDGNIDVATPGYSPATATILWGNGAGNFPTQTQFPIGGFSVSLVAGDFNHDNKLDLATPSFNESSVYVFLGDGARGFSTPIISNASATPYAVTKGDFNQDGKLDLAVVSEHSESVSILQGDGAGGFAQPIQYVLNGEEPKGINAGDFNGDHKLDIVALTRSTNNHVIVLYGDGDGQFSTRQDINVGGVSVDKDPAIADFNNDGKPDIGLEINYAEIVVLLGNGQGQFTQINTPVPPTQINWVAAADVNNDNNQDFIMSEGGIGDVGRIAVHLGDGQGHFSSSIDLPTLENPAGMAIGDFNNDSKPDIAITDYFFASVSIIINTTVVNNVRTLFDATKAYKSGSTIPIKLQLIDCDGVNVSSANTILTAADLRLIGGTTSAPVVDSGNANPDYNFRYIGDGGGSYIFNLSTKNLGAGTYALRFYAGANNSFLYKVEFEVK